MVKRKDNCLLFACRVLRYARDTDHLVIRRSHWGWFPHFAALFELADGSICKTRCGTAALVSAVSFQGAHSENLLPESEQW